MSDLIALLEFVLHPDDPLIRAIVLSSPLAGLTFQTCSRERHRKHSIASFKPWIERRDRATAAEILEDVVRQTNFDVVMTAQKGGRQRVANIGKLIEITRNLGRQGTTALDDVVRYLRARAKDTLVRESEAQTTAQDADVVRLLTVHGAKGLEFDVVIVPDLAAPLPHGSEERLLLQRPLGAACGRRLWSASQNAASCPDSPGQGRGEGSAVRGREAAALRCRHARAQDAGSGRGFCGKACRIVATMGGRPLREGATWRTSIGHGQGKTTRVRFRSRGQDFSVEMLSAAAFTRPEQLPLNIDIAAVNRETRIAEFQELTREP